MAKGSATEQHLGALHAKITELFTKVLRRYEARLDALDEVDRDTITDEVLLALLDDAPMPSPAMLSAVTKFLKDNEINFDSEKIEELSSTERRLADRRENRKNVVNLTTLRAVGDE